jgi:hypothetical protein
MFLRYRTVSISKLQARYQRFFDIVLVRYRWLQPSISKVLRIEAIDIELSFRTRYRRSFSILRYRRLRLRYRNMRASKVQPSISKVGKVPDDDKVLLISLLCSTALVAVDYRSGTDCRYFIEQQLEANRAALLSCSTSFPAQDSCRISCSQQHCKDSEKGLAGHASCIGGCEFQGWHRPTGLSTCNLRMRLAS